MEAEMSPKDCLERIICLQYFLFLCQPFILMAALFLILSCKTGCWQPYQPCLEEKTLVSNLLCLRALTLLPDVAEACVWCVSAQRGFSVHPIPCVRVINQSKRACV